MQFTACVLPAGNVLFTMPSQRLQWSTPMPATKEDARQIVADITRRVSTQAGYATRALFAHVRKKQRAHAAGLDSVPLLFIAPPMMRLPCLRTMPIVLFCGFPFVLEPFKGLRRSSRVFCDLDYEAPDAFCEAVITARMVGVHDAATWLAWSPVTARLLCTVWKHVPLLVLVPSSPHDVSLLVIQHIPHGLSADKQLKRVCSAMCAATIAANRGAAGLRALDAAGRPYVQHELQLFPTCTRSKLLTAALRIARDMDETNMDEFFIQPFMSLLARPTTPTHGQQSFRTVLEHVCKPCVVACTPQPHAVNTLLHVVHKRVYRLQLPVREIANMMRANGMSWRSRDWVRAPELVLWPPVDAQTPGTICAMFAHRILMLYTGRLACIELVCAITNVVRPVVFITTENTESNDVSALLSGQSPCHIVHFDEPLVVRAIVMDRAHIVHGL